MKNAWNLLRLIKLGNRLRVALLILICIGLGLLLLSKVLKENKLQGNVMVHEVGVLFVTITPILFIYELALRRLFVAEMSIKMEEVLNGNFKEHTFRIIKQSMPTSYDNILTRGIVDAFDELDANHLRERIKNSENTEIKMVKMWIPFLNETLQPEVIVDSIVKRGCSYKIVLCDPNCESIIRTRADAAGYDIDYYLLEIKTTLGYLQNVWRKLSAEGADFPAKLEVRAHNYFAAGSLIGFEQYYILGFYLYNRISTQGMQIKVERGVHIQPSTFFMELEKHFQKQWEVSYKDVLFFVDKPFELVQRNTP